MNPAQQQQNFFRISFLICLVLAIIGVGLAVFGYGKLENNLGSEFVVRVNGHSLSATDTKVRPGTYQLEITSARYETVRQTIHVGLLGTTNIDRPTEGRDTNQLIRSVIAANG